MGHQVRVRLAVLCVVVAAAAGCVTGHTVVRIERDGSGTVEETVSVDLASFRTLFAQLGLPDVPHDPGAPFDRADVERTAEQMGARLVSVAPIKDASREGYRAVYAFDDVTRLRLDAAGAAAAAPGPVPAAPPAALSFTFSRSPGGVSILALTLIDPPASSDASQKSGAAKELFDTLLDDPSTRDPIEALFRDMLKGVRFSLDLEVAGAIVKTDADHVEGSRVALLHLNLGELLAQEDVLNALRGKLGDEPTLAAMHAALKDVKGVKINRPVFTIEFK